VNDGQKLPKEIRNENVFPFVTEKMMLASALSFFAVDYLQQLKTVHALVGEHRLFGYATVCNLIK